MNDKERLIHQLFVGKVADLIGFDIASKLLKESKDAIDKMDVNNIKRKE